MLSQLILVKLDTDIKYSTLFNMIITRAKLFIIVGLLAIIMAVIFTSPYFIPPKYKSEAVIYPSNLVHYSDESSTEQLLQFFFGNDIRDSIISKFDLISHYAIDTSSSGFLYTLHKEYDGNVRINKTSFESVSIAVMDTKPKKACAMTKELINQVNNKIRNLHRIKTEELVEIRKNEIDNKKELIDTLETEIKRYSVIRRIYIFYPK